MAKTSERRNYTYRITDLDYPAISVANLDTLLGAYFSAGQSYEFGRSVKLGISNLEQYFSQVDSHCPETQWIFAGYSQGAMVVSSVAERISSQRVLYVGLFGDPELYLPEGGGIFSTACIYGEVSPYRVYVPNCRAKTGIFGARKPYEARGLEGKYGLWCNYNDFICGSSKNPLSNEGHLRYVKNREFEWMANVLYRKLPQRIRYEYVCDDAAWYQDYSCEYKEVNSISPRLTMTLSESTNEVFAIPAISRYETTPWNSVFFDASNSFSSNGDELDYYWRFDGEDEDLTGVIAMCTYAEIGVYHPTLKVCIKDSDICVESELEVVVSNDIVHEEVNIDSDLFYLERGDDFINVKRLDNTSEDLLVKMNGVILGRVDGDLREFTIGDLEFNDGDELTFLILDFESNVKSEVTFEISDIENVANEKSFSDDSVDSNEGSENLGNNGSLEEDNNSDAAPFTESRDAIQFLELALLGVVVVIVIAIRFL